MNDKELLRLAAKAAGLIDMALHDKDMKKYLSRWNPIDSDADALRLAVGLGMMVYVNTENKEVDVCADSKSVFRFNFDSDPYAATRRAISRAAAEIGKEMK